MTYINCTFVVISGTDNDIGLSIPNRNWDNDIGVGIQNRNWDNAIDVS